MPCGHKSPLHGTNGTTLDLMDVSVIAHFGNMCVFYSLALRYVRGLTHDTAFLTLCSTSEMTEITHMMRAALHIWSAIWGRAQKTVKHYEMATTFFATLLVTMVL